MRDSPTDINLAWAAGFLDGEGCFAIGRYNDRKRCRVRYTAIIQVGQKRRLPLDLLETMFGGSIRPQRTPTGGSWLWKVCGTTAYSVCVALIPHLVLKQDEAELLKAFQDRFNSSVANRRRPDDEVCEQEDMYRACRKLKLAV